MSLEERLRRIEELLIMVLRRLEKLEELAGKESLEARLAVEIALSFASTAQEAIEAAAKAARALSRNHGGGSLSCDDICRAIVEALAAKGPLTLRGLEREVRRIRGTASRAAIRGRLEELEEVGIVIVERRGRSMVVKLAEDEEGG